jgi:hypothetical protein
MKTFKTSPRTSTGRKKENNSWRRRVTREHEEIGLRWTDIKSTAKNREKWKNKETKIGKG